MNISLPFGFIALFLASNSNKNQNNSARTNVKNKVEVNTMACRIAAGYFVENKQISKTKSKKIMIENNKEILKKANAAVAAGDYEGFLSYCTDDTIWTFIGDETLEGKEAARQYMVKAYLEPPKFDIETIIGEDDFVTAVGKISLKNEDGKTTQYLYCDVWRFENGKMAELKAFVITAK